MSETFQKQGIITSKFIPAAYNVKVSIFITMSNKEYRIPACTTSISDEHCPLVLVSCPVLD